MTVSRLLCVAVVVLSLGVSSTATAGGHAQDDFLRPVSATDAEALPAPDTVVDDDLKGGGSSDALYICCAAGYCTYAAIEDCSLLSPAGKIVALSVAGVAAVSGFFVGFMGGAVLLAGHDVLDPSNPYDAGDDADTLLAMGFLGGAAGFVVGGALGMLSGFIIDPLCWPASSWRPTTPRPRDGPSAPPRMGMLSTTTEVPRTPLMAHWE